MEKVKSVTTTYVDEAGEERTQTVVRDISRDCLAKDKPDCGIKVQGGITYSDGSFRSSYGVVSKPAPLGGEFPRARPAAILKYWELFHQKRTDEFDKLKRILEARTDSFQINKNGRSIDAVERLEEIRLEVADALYMYGEAAEAYNLANPMYCPVKYNPVTLEIATRQADFKNKVRGIELDGVISKPQRKSRR